MPVLVICQHLPLSTLDGMFAYEELLCVSLNVIVTVVGVFVMIIVLVSVVVDVISERVDTEVVAFATIEEEVTCVERVKFPAGAVTLCVGPRSNTAA